MIIKSKTRKDKSFSALVQYMLREDAKMKHQSPDGRDDSRLFTLLHNIDDDVMPDDIEGISNDFLENSKYLRDRKNGIMMYHEIASFAPGDASKIEGFMLEDIARKYVETRSPNGLALARSHFDKDHIHVHFLFSGNERGNGKRLRVSKKEFQEQRREVEEYQLKHYPQLSQSYVHSRDKEKYKQQRQERESDRSREMKKQGKKQTLKSKLSMQVMDVMVFAQNLESVAIGMEKKGFEVYHRGGVPYGIVQGERKFRFSTLLKGTDYEEQIKLLSANEEQMELAKKRLLKLKNKPSKKKKKIKR